ncbi:MAG: helix-hairpin-helix domain-containing protein [Anaerolineae bacterium]|nr:helix-hairpin-helix domain-containing protein [Anaerolineae bacterium]
MKAWLGKPKIFIPFFLALIAAGGLLYWWVNRPKPLPIIIATPVPTATPTPVPTPTPAPLRVYVTGAVLNPDVYVLPPGSIIKDALAAAGGAVPDADLEQINLALSVYDQQQIYVPRRGEIDLPIALPQEQPAGAQTADSGVVNINEATLEQLDTLPGIGPAIAERIIKYRAENGPFEIAEDLMNVKGIGPTTFEKLKDKITTQ